MGKPKRKYLFYDQMKFLISETNGDEPEYIEDVNVPFMKEENESEDEVIVTPTPRKRIKRVENSDDAYAPRDESCSYTHNSKKRSRKREATPEETPSKTKDNDSSATDIDFVEVNDADQRLMNEDEAFFASLLPTVVKYNEDERLEFRIEVLGVMKRIKESRKWNPGEDQ